MTQKEILKMFQKGQESKEKEFNAMVNYGGGEVHFGVGEIKQSDGSINWVVEDGVVLTDSERQEINDAIHNMFWNFNKPCFSILGDYEIKWEPGTDSGRYRFKVIIYQCSEYNNGYIVLISNDSAIQAFTRCGSASVPIKTATLKEKLNRSEKDYLRWMQSSIDAVLIMKLRDAFDKLEGGEMAENDLICVLQQYTKEIDRQRYLSEILVMEVLDFMVKLWSKYGTIKIADEMLNLGYSLYCWYVRSRLRNLNEGELNNDWSELKEASDILFEVCLEVAGLCVKYDDKIFAKAAGVLANILGILYLHKTLLQNKYNELLPRYNDQLNSFVKSSNLDNNLQEKLTELIERLLSLSHEGNYSKNKFSLEKQIIDLGYTWQQF